MCAAATVLQRILADGGGDISMMDKSAQNVIRSLRARIPKKPGSVVVRIGAKRYELPTDVQVAGSERYGFVVVPPLIGLYRIEGRDLKAMEPTEDASEAFAELSGQSARKPGRPKAIRELPDVLKEALRQIPEGYRIGYDPDGTPKLVRKRNRRKRKGGQDAGS